MKKLIIVLILAINGYNANLFASIAKDYASRISVAIPFYRGGITFGLIGLYWRPNNNDLNYALSFDENGESQHVEHPFNWGAQANLGYYFPCTANDLRFIYTHWHNNQVDIIDNDDSRIYPNTFAPLSVGINFSPATLLLTTRIVPPLPALSVPTILPSFSFLFRPDDLTEIRAKSHFENSTWDVNFGQTQILGNRFHLHCFAGLRCCNLRHSLNVIADFDALRTITTPQVAAVGTALTPASTTLEVLITPTFDIAARLHEVSHQASKFAGAGPNVGFDIQYDLGKGVGLIAGFCTSLLVGETESTYYDRSEATAAVALDLGETLMTPVSASPALPVIAVLSPGIAPINPDQIISYKHPDEARIVPTYDAKLGFNWRFQLHNCTCSRMILEAGYKISHYVNAVDRLSDVAAFIPEYRSRKSLDMSFDGPYIGLQFVI